MLSCNETKALEHRLVGTIFISQHEEKHSGDSSSWSLDRHSAHTVDQLPTALTITLAQTLRRQLLGWAIVIPFKGHRRARNMKFERKNLWVLSERKVIFACVGDARMSTHGKLTNYSCQFKVRSCGPLKIRNLADQKTNTARMFCNLQHFTPSLLTRLSRKLRDNGDREGCIMDLTWSMVSSFTMHKIWRKEIGSRKLESRCL